MKVFIFGETKLLMDFPYIMQAYQPTRSGDALLKEQIVNNEIDVASFREKYNKYKIVIKEDGELDLDPESRNQAIEYIKSQVPIHYAVSVKGALAHFRNNLQKKDENNFFRVKIELMKSIAEQLVQIDKKYKHEFINGDYFISLADKQSTWTRLTTHPSWGFYGAIAAIVTIPIGILLVTNPTVFTCNRITNTSTKNIGDTVQVKTKQSLIVFDTSMKNYKPNDSTH